MTLPIHVKPIVSQEKGEKHVFRKSKKYRTLCSVALGTVATAIIVLGGPLVKADELTASTTPEVVLTDNPATNLPEAKPEDTSGHQSSLAETGQAQGIIPVTIEQSSLEQAVSDAKAEGVTVVDEKPLDLGTTTSSEATTEALQLATTDQAKQVETIQNVTSQYREDKAEHLKETNRINGENEALKSAHAEAEQSANDLNQSVDEKEADLNKRFNDVDLKVTEKKVSSGDGTSPVAYRDYVSSVTDLDRKNQSAIDGYIVKKIEADKQLAQNKQIEADNAAGLAKAEADNAAIAKRNQEGQAAIDEENRRGQAAVDASNRDKEKQASDRQAEIAAITARNKAKEEQVAAQNRDIEAYNLAERARYERELAEIQRGEEGYISEALAQALNLNSGEPQARHSAVTRQPDSTIPTGDPMLGGYSNILDSTGFFVYDQFQTGETLRFTYQNLQNASFAGKKITGVQYDITNLVSPTGTNSVRLVVPNDPTEGFIAYRGDGTGDWRTDRIEFEVAATYTLSDGSQVTFSKDQPGVFTHSSLNHNNIGLEYVKDTSGKFVTINGSTIQVTNEGLARSLGSNRAHEIGTPEEWDTTSSRYAYKGAIVSTVTAGNTYRVTFGQGDMPTQVGGKTYWFALNTLPVVRTVTPYTPKTPVKVNLELLPDPIKVTPDVFTPKTFTPEPEVSFTPKPTTPVEQPKLTLVKVTPPTKPVYEKLPEPPAVPTVAYHGYNLATTPMIHKEVTNSDKQSIDKHLVAKSSPVNYPLVVDDLSPNRVTTISLVFEDNLPRGYVLDEGLTATNNSSYEVTYDSAKHIVRLSAKDSLLAEVNKNLSQSYHLTAPVLYGTVVNDGATYTNTYKLHINQGTPTAYTVTSNPVTVSTPGDGTTTTLIRPDKENKNSDGVIINDKVVLAGTVNHYTLTWDLDQYKGDKSSQETIAKGFFLLDDFPEEALTTDDKAVVVTDLTGQVMTGFTATTYTDISQAPQLLQDQLTHAKISPKGAFQVIVPEDNQAFYDAYVQAGTSLLVTSPMTVRADLTGKKLSYTNKAYQIDFGNGYATKEVTNTLVTPEPVKKNLNADKVDINGQAMLVGSTNFFTLSWDLDQYKGIEATKEAIAKGFYFVDDYPEEALDIDTAAVQVVKTSGKVVSDLLVETYSSLDQAPEALRLALSAKQIRPTGAFQVFRPKDNQVFYDTYVNNGQSLTIIDPMTVKSSLYNSGQTYTNKAYQVDFGQAYETEEVSNFIPVVTPKKSNTNDKGITIDGKSVLPGTVNYYKVAMDYSAYKGMAVTKDQIAKGFYMVDDYPEEALDLNLDGIQMVDSNGELVKGLTVTAYASLTEAPQAVQEAMASKGFKPTGAIQVFAADDPASFYENYVKNSLTIVVTNPMTIKADFHKAGGEYTNTAYQLDFGLAYVTETVVNNVPKLDPKKDVVIDLTNNDQSLDGKEVALGQVFNYRLTGALIPADRATALTDYSFSDDYDEAHDQYDGVYKAFVTVDVTLTDGTILKAGTEVTRHTLQTVDTQSGQVAIHFDQGFLTSISDQSTFQADVYLQVKRIAAGEVENTFVHTVNGVTISSNTVRTTTPEPVEPPSVTPPKQDVSTPPASTPPTPHVPGPRLPETGETFSLFGLIGGGLMLGLAYGLSRKKNQLESEAEHA
ncbi:SspB-related isopeptide-forming adhesin [Streptococcus pyogenes]|uniref:SspB-related isopeptide-forming adhesin n=1 Tax=Streptococcus pyogenes TaxID=1314 RepID=UPI00109C52E3|nr:SspB-related isopeptide-forming adhesin [Streptococcus pyogenes]VHC84679.1 agglutinin receptor [Streptococcus pyogenes]